MILYKAADLIWATRIKETADALGLPCRPARNPDMLDARLAEGPVAAFLLDLHADDALDLLMHLRAADASPKPRVLAFGPHVRKELLQAARDGGADEVMTNGAFEHDLPEVLIRLAGRGP
ncbi:MAG: hypothetical protein AAGG07_00730 [Planctomycetota bacterium]